MEIHERITIAEYQLTAQDFRLGTWNHDVSQNRNALITAMSKPKGRVLDLGCGPGRDLVAFQEMGYEVTGLDATPAFVEMAKQITGCQILEQCFLSLNLPKNSFDGIFANASLIHVPRAEILRVLEHLNQALNSRGVLLMSMVRGNHEGFSERSTGYRYVTGWEYETLRPKLEATKFEIIDHYYRPQGMPTKECPWLVILSKKIS